MEYGTSVECFLCVIRGRIHVATVAAKVEGVPQDGARLLLVRIQLLTEDGADQNAMGGGFEIVVAIELARGARRGS